MNIFNSLYDRFKQDPNNHRLLTQEELILDITEEIIRALDNKVITRQELAEKLGKSRPWLLRLLSGDDKKLTIRSLADVAYFLDCRVQVKLIEDEKRG